MKKDKRYLISFYLKKSAIDDIDEILSDPYSTFESRSHLIRYCVQQQIGLIKKENDEKK